ncbi:MAG: hypothetical protein OXC11_07580 [Rhodospirillales bacterium]|nr:hypothetical protein [Rhodospirillales bacterium]
MRSVAVIIATTMITDANPGYAAAQNSEDASTDNWRIAISADSESPPSTHRFDRDERSRLVVQCTRDRPVLGAVWNSSTNSFAQRAPMKMWFDHELVESEDWTYGDESAYRGNLTWLVERLLDTRIFTIEYGGRGFRDQEISATFDLSGFGKAIKAVQHFCGW